MHELILAQVEAPDSGDAAAAFFGMLLVMLSFGVVLFAPLLTLGIIGWIGASNERSHRQQMDKREAALGNFLTTDLETPPPGLNFERAGLVVSSVVFAPDRWKSFCARIRKFFGGEFKLLQRVQERARREALLRLREQAYQRGASVICNVRLETSSIVGKRKGSIAGCEIIASGTALFPPGAGARNPIAPPVQVQQSTPDTGTADYS